MGEIDQNLLLQLNNIFYHPKFTRLKEESNTKFKILFKTEIKKFKVGNKIARIWGQDK